MIKFLIAFLLPLFFVCNANAASSNANILSINTASTNITTSAYVQLSASSPITTRKVLVANGTSSIILVAIGAAGSEQGLFAIFNSASVIIDLSNTLPAGSRISLEAVSATASSGYVTVSLMP